MSEAPLAAVTGGTGFFGRYIVNALSARGWRVRVLVHRTPGDFPREGQGIGIVRGDLSDLDALRILVTGADAVIHAGAVVAAPRRAVFRAVNVEGTTNLARAVKECIPAARTILISSIAAREPQLSPYAQTKYAAEGRFMTTLGPRANWVIVRPSVIYGPHDGKTLAFFRAVGQRIFLEPRMPGARITLIHADDAARAVADLCGRGPSRETFELTDARVGGYSWDEIVATAAQTMHVKVVPIRLPRTLVRLAAILLSGLPSLSRDAPILTPEKAREILHADWSSRAERQPPRTLWEPRIDLARGFEETVRWYREVRWLTPGRPRPG